MICLCASGIYLVVTMIFYFLKLQNKLNKHKKGAKIPLRYFSAIADNGALTP
jgi:hypothetical protein